MAKQASPESGTVIWGAEHESEDFIKVPRTVIFLGRCDPDLARELQPRHFRLLLVLAARKFQNKPNRAYWIELAIDCGTKPATVRKWAYELEKLGFLAIKRHKGKSGIDGRPGHKNDRNTFDLSPFMKKLTKAYGQRKAERQAGKKKRRGKLGGEA